MNEMKLCPKCNTENPAVANFCRRCRHDFRIDGDAPIIIPAPDDTTASGDTSKPSIVRSRIFLFSILALCIIGGSGALYIYSTFDKDKHDALSEVIVNYKPETFSGNYAVMIQTENEKQRYTAVVCQFASSAYRIEVVSEYGTINYTFEVNSDGTLLSPELGKGVVSYKSAIRKLMIEFSMEDVKCVLSRVQ